MKTLQTFFFWPIAVSCVLLGLVGYYAGLEAFVLVSILSVLEVTLSFDNAVVNAKVLAHMPALWQHRFLTWGIFLAVFGTRFVLPIVIVSVAVGMAPWLVAKLAIVDPAAYGALLTAVHSNIGAFGAAFLMMVALKYFFDRGKEIYWIELVEKRFSKWGNIEALEIAITLSILVLCSFLSHANPAGILVSGIIGLVLFIIMEGLSGSLSAGQKDVARSGISLFLYLEVLDAAFSLDGVVGAFALTSDIILIMVGLGIGAYFVRAITLYLVEHHTLARLKYLEHGAHWAILGLSLAMFSNLVIHIPEVLIGLIGLIFISLSYHSSAREMRG